MSLSFRRIALRAMSVVFACAVVVGCAGSNESNLAPQMNQGSSASLAAGRHRPPQIRFGKDGNVRFFKTAAAHRAAELTALATRRAPQAIVGTANEQQEAGITWPALDINGDVYEGFQFYASADPTLQLPAPASGTDNLLSPDVIVGSDSCLEIYVQYENTAGNASPPAPILWVHDTCSGARTPVATIDSTFVSTYESNANGVGNQFFAELFNFGGGWSFFLYNPSDNNGNGGYDDFYDSSDLDTTKRTGQAVFNIDSFVIGACPTITTQSTSYLGTYVNYNQAAPDDINGSILQPTIVGGSGTPDCFLTTPATSPHYVYSAGPYDGSYDVGWVIDNVAASSHTPPPHPTPTPTATPSPTPTPTATPTPTPSPTPTPTPTPTATPTPTPTPPGPLTVTVEGTTYTVHAGVPQSLTISMDGGSPSSPLFLTSLVYAEAHGTASLTGNCYLPGSANHGYGTGPAYIPTEYLGSGFGDYDVYSIRNGSGALTCQENVQGSGGEIFTLYGKY